MAEPFNTPIPTPRSTSPVQLHNLTISPVSPARADPRLEHILRPDHPLPRTAPVSIGRILISGSFSQSHLFEELISREERIAKEDPPSGIVAVLTSSPWPTDKLRTLGEGVKLFASTVGVDTSILQARGIETCIGSEEQAVKRVFEFLGS